MKKFGLLIVTVLGLLVAIPQESEAADYKIKELTAWESVKEEGNYVKRYGGGVIFNTYPEFIELTYGGNKTRPPIQVIQTSNVRYVSFSDTVRGERFRNFVAESEKLPKGKEVEKLRNVYLTDLQTNLKGMVPEYIEPDTDIFLFDVGDYYWSGELYGAFAHEYGHLFNSYWLLTGKNKTEEWKQYVPAKTDKVSGKYQYMFDHSEYLAEQYRMIYYAQKNTKGYRNVRDFIYESYNPNVPMFNTELRNYWEKRSGVKSPASTENPISPPMVSIDKYKTMKIKASFSRTTKNQEVAFIIGMEEPYQSMPDIRKTLREKEYITKHFFFTNPYLGNVKDMTYLINVNASMYSKEILAGKPFWVRVVSRDRSTGAISDSNRLWYKYYNGSLICMVKSDKEEM